MTNFYVIEQFFNLIRYLMVFWTSQKINLTLIRDLNLHRLKAPRLKEHANFSAPHRFQARSRARITLGLHVSSNRS